MPQTVLFFGGPAVLRCAQEEMFQSAVVQKGYTCRTFEKDMQDVRCVVREDWDFFVAGEIGRRFEETRFVVDLLLQVPNNTISAFMFKRLSGCKVYEVYSRESWRYLQMECPSVRVFRLSGFGTAEEVHKEVMKCIGVCKEKSHADRFPYRRHD